VVLSKNAFGNYVVQNFFNKVDYQLKDELYLKIAADQQLINDIQSSQFGTRHLSAIRLVCVLEPS
jgi:hypothetical protein